MKRNFGKKKNYGKKKRLIERVSISLFLEIGYLIFFGVSFSLVKSSQERAAKDK